MMALGAEGGMSSEIFRGKLLDSIVQLALSQAMGLGEFLTALTGTVEGGNQLLHFLEFWYACNILF